MGMLTSTNYSKLSKGYNYKITKLNRNANSLLTYTISLLFALLLCTSPEHISDKQYKKNRTFVMQSAFMPGTASFIDQIGSLVLLHKHSANVQWTKVFW